MAYNINLTNGQNLVTVADGTVNSANTSLVLIGKNYAGYGEFLNENFIKLLENFSNSSPPSNPLPGQIYWDSTAKILKVFNGTNWKTVSSSTSSAVNPVTPVVGDTWWDTVNSQLKVWSGSSWVVIGPAYTSTQGQTGAFPDVVTEVGSLNSHIIVKFFVNNTCVAVLSKDPAFNVANLPGFDLISPGLTLSSLGNFKYFGDANNALNLGGYPAADYLRSTDPINTNAPVNITNNAGLTIGANDDFTISVTSTDVNLTGNISGKNLSLLANVNNVVDRYIKINGLTGSVTVNADPIDPLGIATMQYVMNRTGPAGSNLARDGSNTITGNIVPDTANTRNLGSAVTMFSTIYATTFAGNASTANYADLAERFAADAAYVAGTVVELGGEHEITVAKSELSNNVFGVISTDPAYLMNADAGNNDTHPPVALNGRVPVLVRGTVVKGDRLVSAGGGFARAALDGEVTSQNVIGRALANKNTDGDGSVEAIVKINI